MESHVLSAGMNISIHSLRAEGDQIAKRITDEHLQFQSTPSVRRETSAYVVHLRALVISIHSLRAEGDRT